MRSWERLTWQEWDFLDWETWGKLLLYAGAEELDRGPVAPTCQAATQLSVLEQHTGWFWNTASPVASLYAALQEAICSYADKLLEDLCIAAKNNTVFRSEFYYKRRRLLLLLDATADSWDLTKWNIIEIANICNRASVDDPNAVVLSPGEFTISGSTLRFVNNIVDDPRFVKINDGDMRYVVCWAIEPTVVDYGLYHNFGAALVSGGVPIRAVRDLIKRLWDATLNGFSAWHYFAIDAALRMLPLAEHDGERVIRIETERATNVVVTDSDRYLLGAHEPAVRENDILRAGQPLVAGHRYFDFRLGTVPEDVECVIVPAESLQYFLGMSPRRTERTAQIEYRLLEDGSLRALEDDDGYAAGMWIAPPGKLTLFNRNVPVTVNHTAKTVSWTVSTDPAVTAWFWNETRKRELKYGVRLYDLLKAKYGDIPSSINPLAFFAEHVFRGGVFVIMLPPTLLYGRSFKMLDLVAPGGVFVVYAATHTGLSESESESESESQSESESESQSESESESQSESESESQSESESESQSESESESQAPITYTHFERCGGGGATGYAAGGFYDSAYEDGTTGICYRPVDWNYTPGVIEITPQGPFPSCDECRCVTFTHCDDYQSYWARGGFTLGEVYKHSSLGCLYASSEGRAGSEITEGYFIASYHDCDTCRSS